MEVLDGLVDLLIQVVHRMGTRAERKVMKTLLEDLRKVHGKTGSGADRMCCNFPDLRRPGPQRTATRTIQREL